MRILSVDPMSCFAVFDGKVARTFSVDKNHKEYSFYSKMIDILGIMKGGIKYDVVVFEETRFPYINSQRIMYAQLAILRVLLYPSKTKLVTITPKEVKKLFTGNGNADKEAMIAEAKKRGFDPKDDHQADAIGIYYSYKLKYNVK